MALGNVLGGIATGYVDTTTKLDENRRLNQVGKDLHKHQQHVQLGEGWAEDDASRQRMLDGLSTYGDGLQDRVHQQVTSIGQPVQGAAGPGAHPVENWLSDHNIDMSSMPAGSTAADYAAHPIFNRRPTAIPDYASWGAPPPAAIPADPYAAVRGTY